MQNALPLPPQKKPATDALVVAPGTDADLREIELEGGREAVETERAAVESDKPGVMDNIQRIARDSGEAIKEVAENVGENIAAGSRVAGREAIKLADRALDNLATYPENPDGPVVPRNILSKLVSVAPIIGPTKAFADARAKFAAAAENNDEKLKMDARRECLFACIEFGIDITFLPLAAAAEGASFTTRALQLFKNGAEIALIKQLRQLNKKLGLKLDRRFASQVLKSPIAVKAIDQLLSFAESAPETAAAQEPADPTAS